MSTATGHDEALREIAVELSRSSSAAIAARGQQLLMELGGHH